MIVKIEETEYNLENMLQSKALAKIIASELNLGILMQALVNEHCFRPITEELLDIVETKLNNAEEVMAQIRNLNNRFGEES